MKNFDCCTSFHLNNGAVMGRLVRLDKLVNIILGKHKYPKDVSNVVAEATALAALLSSTIKYEGLFTLQTQTNGAIPMLVVDVTSEGLIRACARFDEERIEKLRNPNEKYKLNDDEILEVPHWLGGGLLAFTVDQGTKDMTQGIVDLKGKTLSECAMKYFKESEQIETHLQLFLQAPQNENDGWKSAGIIIQKLPTVGGKKADNAEETWEEAVIFAQSLKKEEIFDTGLTAEDLLNRLYHSNELVINGVKEYKFGCRCSRDKLLGTLRSFSPEELEDMCEKNKISAHCHFCSEQYVFDKGELSTH